MSQAVAEPLGKQPKQDSSTPSPYGKSGPDYLLAKGWKCIGDPDWPDAGWLDPTKPLQDSWTTEKIEAYAWVPAGADERGQRQFKRVLQHISVQDGQGAPVRPELAYREHFHPKVQPVDIKTAIMVQMNRDLAEQAAKLEQTAKK